MQQDIQLATDYSFNENVYAGFQIVVQQDRMIRWFFIKI